MTVKCFNFVGHIRCEFVNDDVVSDESDAYLVSSAFILKDSFSVVLLYFVTSPDIAVELLIVSQQSEQVLQRHSLSRQKNMLYTSIANTTEPIFLVVHAYLSRSITTSSSSSVVIMATYLIPDSQGQSAINLCY